MPSRRCSVMRFLVFGGSRGNDEAGVTKQESKNAEIAGILREHSEMLKNISEQLSQI